MPIGQVRGVPDNGTMNCQESEIAATMKEQLMPYCNWIRTESKLSNSSLAKPDRELSIELGYVPVLQPDIDICFSIGDELCAVELKSFGSGGRSDSFYTGIGQALALQRYGVDRIALWAVFEDERDLVRLASAAWYFVRNQALLSLDFTPYLVREDGGKTCFEVWQYLSQSRAGSSGCYFSQSARNFRHPNPLISGISPDPDSRVIRRHLQGWLESKLRETDINPIDRLMADYQDAGPTGPM